MKDIVFLGGLPRTGSTLLSAILCQNPSIYTEGNSALCQIMWDTHISCTKNSKEQLAANNRQTTIYDITSAIPGIYYKDVNEPIIIDKCRTWTLPDNINLIEKYIGENYKMIILERSILEILKSFGRVHRENNSTLQFDKLLETNSDPIMRSIFGIYNIKNNIDTNKHLFISYNDLVNNAENTIKKIYDFCNWEYFNHDFKNIVMKNPENDNTYSLKNFHNVRPVLKQLKYDIEIPKDVEEKCKALDKFLGYANTSDNISITENK